MTKPLSTVTNQEVAALFYRMAALLRLKEDENPYRINAYEKAAQTVEYLSTPLAEMDQEALVALPGIGNDLAAKIIEILLTGRLSAYEALEKEVHPSTAALLEIQGLGPKRVKQLIRELGIETIEELEEAALAGKIHLLPGFGYQSEQNILKALETHRQSRGRMKRALVDGLVQPLVDYLHRVKGVEQVVVAGSYRRRKEMIGDLDILVTGQADSPVMEAFTGYPLCREILSQGPTRSSIRLNNGLQVDLRYVEAESFGSALYYFTGSKAHNVALRTIAKAQGLKINEYGIYRGNERIAGETEESVFRVFEMDYIPPVLRENRGELEAAREHRLPHLLELADIRGDLHVHTRASDGRNTIREMAEAAMASGLEYVAITDHSQSTAGGLTPDEFMEHLVSIEKVGREMSGIRVLKGGEVDIHRDGSLDLPDEVLMQMDVVVASVHGYFGLEEEEQTERILRAMAHPMVTVIGHLTARRLPDREPIRLNLERVFEAAAESGTWLEVNGSPDRMDLSGELVKQAKEAGVKFLVNTDSHNVHQFGNRRYGVEMAQRGWLEKGDVVNALSLREFEKLLRQPKAARSAFPKPLTHGLRS